MKPLIPAFAAATQRQYGSLKRHFGQLCAHVGESVNPGWATFGVCLLLICGLWITLYVYETLDRASAYHSAETQTQNYARLLEEHTARTLRVLDQATVFVKTEYERVGPGLDLKKYAQRGVFLDQFFNLIAVVGPDGWVITADRDLPNSNIADSEYFKVHIAEDSGKLFISIPVPGHSSEKWSIQFTRRINKPDGSFGGVVVASLDSNYFGDFYGTLNIGEGSVAQLFGNDGVLRARRSGGTNGTGQDIAQSDLFRRASEAETGILNSISSLDGVKRLYGFRKLKDYPLIVSVGITETLIYAEFYEHVNALRAMAALATALILLSALAVLVLINSQTRIQAALRNSEQTAVSASRMKSEFIARMSHELRTPLNGILGFSEYLQTSAESAENREFATTINQAGKHLLNLVNTTLDLAKIEAGHMEIIGKPEALEPIVRQVATLQRSFAEGKGLLLVTDLWPNLPAQIICDSTKLIQVLNNLVHNAIKFTENGSVTLRVQPDGGRLLFSVTDTGPGISTEQQSQLFERFHQLDATFNTRSHEGTGLGLSLAKQLVELMGGNIWIESRVGHGASFLFTLPLRRRVSDRVRELKEGRT